MKKVRMKKKKKKKNKKIKKKKEKKKKKKKKNPYNWEKNTKEIICTVMYKEIFNGVMILYSVYWW